MIKSTIGIVSPYGSTNYVLNPSGEIADNFSAQGGATVSRSTVFQRYGLYSYEIVAVSAGQGINLTLLTLTDAPHYVTFRVHNANGSQDNVRLNITIGSKTMEARLLEKVDRGSGVYWDLYGATFAGANVVSQTNLRITQVAANNHTLYIDGVQVEPMIEPFPPGGIPIYSTYIDGTQEGCRWNGTAHGSTSTRSADSRAGGIVKDFWQGYGFFPEKVLGAGAVVEDLNIDSYAFLPGGELNSSKIQPREFTIIGFFLGNSKEDLHAKAQALELELGLDTYPGRQPVRIRYFGAAVQKEIAAHYAGGLEGDLPIFYNDDLSVEDEQWMRNYKFRMRASIQFKALDPFWYEVGESATLLDTNDDDTFRVVAARLMETGQWSSLGPPSAGGTYTRVRAIAEDGQYIYFGGLFVNWNGAATSDGIVRYEKSTGTYSSLGTGVNSEVFTLLVGPDGILYVGGDFTTAGGGAASGIATWDGSSWAQLGGGLNGGVEAMVFGLDGTLYLGGSFINVAGGSDDYIVAWDGSAYVSIGTMENFVYALAIGLDGTLYAGGEFANADGVADTAFIAAYNGSVWSGLGSVAFDNAVNVLAISSNGNLYAGGAFTTVGNRLAVWNGTVWTSLGDGVDSNVYSLVIGVDGTVYIGGFFTQAGDIALSDRVTRWNGYTFSHLDINLPGTPIVYSILASKYVDPIVSQKYSLYLGFDTSGTGAYAGLASVQNSGTISAFPKIIFNRDGGDGATIQTLRNERTGRELLFDYALLDGETLTIDLNPKNRTIVSSFFGSRMDARLKNDDFSVWQLLPGDNPVSAFVSEDGSPTVTGYILYRTPYRSWN